MAWTQNDIDALKKAIASGVDTVTYAGPPARSVRYRSMDDMLKALSLMEREVNGGATTYRRVVFDKGFYSDDE